MKIEDRNFKMKKLLYILLLTIFIKQFAFSQSKYELETSEMLLRTSHFIALCQVGTVEDTGNNDGEQIAEYLRSVGIHSPAPYCMAGQYYCFYKAKQHLNIKTSIPIPRSGVANSAFNFAKKHGKKTEFKPQKHDLITWKSRHSWTGHVERIDVVGKAGWVYTIGFNTSNGKTGSQRNGDGVFYRKRNIKHVLGRLYVRGLVGFKVK
jgi:hypothetical protein